MAVLTFSARHTWPGGFTLDAAFETSAKVTALFGPSGSGKTSVVETISGMRSCVDQCVRLGNVVLADSAAGIDRPPERRAVGAVFQDLLLFPHMNVERNLRYGVYATRDGGPAVEFDRLVQVLELASLLSRSVRTLSGGERQRVALGRALLSRPRLLVMDEPLVALDERLKLRILGHLERALSEWAIPALFVSHSPVEVRRLAQWVVLMDKGHVTDSGEPEAVLAGPGVMALKNDSRPMNLLRMAQLREEGERRFGDVGGQWLQLPGEAPALGEEVFVEIPPESILLSREDVPGISARNHLRGTVRQIVVVGGASFVGVDVGQMLWAELTPGAVDELGLAKGVPVFCLIKTQSLRIV